MPPDFLTVPFAWLLVLDWLIALADGWLFATPLGEEFAAIASTAGAVAALSVCMFWSVGGLAILELLSTWEVGRDTVL